jgi:serine O-acetyltransferase
MFDDLREDLRRFGTRPSQQLAGLVLSPGAWATLGYRATRWLHTAKLPRPLRLPGKLLEKLVPNAVIITTNIQIPPATSIGPGLFIAHAGYVVMSYETKIGRHCTVTQGVTLGHGAGGGRNREGSPRIGDRVYLGPGSIIIGDIEVGDDALIGPGAVVVRSVPARAVVVGNPARVISYKGSFDLIQYPGMESDPDRRASLEARDRDAATAARRLD